MDLSAVDIYDAATDDGLFNGLASRIAAEVGARSAVLHWRSPGHAREAEISYSGYFSCDDMALYDKLPWGSDLWAHAINTPAARNRVWDLERLVPQADYLGSIAYNDWIRKIGDDTFRCLGGAIENDSVVLEIGMHRGRQQESFSTDTVQFINTLARPLLQMVKTRQLLASARRSSTSMSSALDMLGTAVFKVGADCSIIYNNAAADAILARSDGLLLHNNKLKAAVQADQAQLERAISAAAMASDPQASAVAVRRSSGEVYACSLIPVFLDGGRTTLMMVRDPDLKDESLKTRLRTIYKLSEAEAHIALALAGGKTIEQIAEDRGTRIDTIRTQFKTMAAKMSCRRQHEVAGLVQSLPLFNQCRKASEGGLPRR